MSARRTPSLLCLGALLAGCGGTDAPAPPLFVECAAAAGVDVPLTCGDPAQEPSILEVNGNGAALADLDGDGDLDLVLVDGSTRARLMAGDPVAHVVLLNQGVRDGVPRFLRSPEPTGLEQRGWPTGISAGDVDQDGRVDLLVGGLGEDALFLNRTPASGAVRFEKRALPGRRSPQDWTASLALADADGDGRLDAWLTRYLTIDPARPPFGHVEAVPCTFHGYPVMCGPHGLPEQTDVYLRGRDAEPWFEEAAPLQGAAVPPSYGLGVVFGDLDGDGWSEVYVANDSQPNLLLANRGAGRFEDVSLLSGAATDSAGRPRAGMGVDLGDYDRDGDFDLVITNFSDEGTALFRNDGQLLFRDVAAAAGIAAASRPLLGWGVQLADFDADGWLDLYTSNGHVYPQADLPHTGTSYAQPQQLFRGGPGGRLVEMPFPDERPARGRCAVRGDLDGDGDLDLIALTLGGTPRLYLNRTDAPERQLLVTLQDGAAPVFGAVLALQTPGGPLVSQALSSRGFQGVSDPRLHFGGGGPVTAATVRWPGGALETLPAEAFVFGRHLTVARGRGVIDSRPLAAVPEARS
jgi:hypothetical protein